MYKISITPEEIEKLPLGSFPGEIHVIDSPGWEYTRAISYLKKQHIIGFDTETRPVFEPNKPHCHVALLQLSGPGRAYLFRINKLGMRKRLTSILTNPSIIKVGAAVHDDVRGLQYYNKFQAAGFVDLQKIGWEWGIKDKSVKKMAGIIMKCRISKTQQLSNWEAAELSPAQQMYAATDAWICREMYLKLMNSPKNPLTPEQLAPNQTHNHDKSHTEKR
ncbi:MAG: 3'-5' exonuclease domain-containing protein 2 [Bacteroidales bacterium]|nr:3'-5' exonuclease domain-containing protein 2 [Candidatus Cryptobacteroides equifaecalis]